MSDKYHTDQSSSIAINSIGHLTSAESEVGNNSEAHPDSASPL